MSDFYQKIPGPFKRDPATNKLTDEWSSPELAYLAQSYVPFYATEKVDGTNIRVMWDGYRVTFGGRTDNAQLHGDLWAWLTAKFGGPEKEQLFEQKFGTDPVVLFGEGYGPKVQSGGKYRDDVSVVFFDVKIGSFWLTRESQQDIADYFQLDLVPLITHGQNSLYELIGLVKSGVESRWGGPEGLAGPREYHTAEGLVAVTTAGLLNRKGERIIVKLKGRDFPV